MGADVTAFARALDHAVRASGLSLHTISRRLHEAGAPLAPSALSYWRNGRRRPEGSASHEAIRVLEEILALDSGALADLVGPSRRPPPESLADCGELMGHAGGVEPLLRALGVGAEERYAVVPTGATLTVDVDPHGRVVSTSARILWRARHDGARRAVLYVPVRSAAEDQPTLVAGSGCRVGRAHHDRTLGLLGVELLLERPLEVNETVMTECAVEGPQSPSSTTSCGWVVENRVVEAVLWVRFSAGRVPSSCRSYAESDAGSLDSPARLHGTTAHVVVRSFGPGAFGLRWDWPAPEA